MIQNHSFVLFSGLTFYTLFPLAALAQNHVAKIDVSPNAIETQIPEPKIDVDKPEHVTTEIPAQLKDEINSGVQKVATATLDDIKQNKELAETALNIGILQNQWGMVEAVLPIYRAFSDTDPVLIDYAQAGLYLQLGEYKKAISLYRKMIAENPDMLRVRMDLAIALFADHQDIAARDQFVKLRSDPHNDEYANEMIDKYLNVIDKRSAWSFGGGLSYIHDDNINNASSSKTITVGDLTFEKEASSLPQSAQGVDLSLTASKDFNLSGSNYLSFDANGYGKIYWDNHKYDDINFRVASGYKYKDARNTVAVTPFAKLRYVNSNPYSKALGFSLSGSRWLTPSWQISNYNELSWEKSDLNPDEASERQFFSSANVLWAPKSTQYFMLGGSVFDVKTESDARSYTRPGVSFIWNQDWSFGGLSTKVNLGYAQKKYKGISFYGVKRADKEYNASLTIWNRDWHYAGITPKISLKYSKTDSNIDDLYTYDKTSVFLKFDKTF